MATTHPDARLGANTFISDHAGAAEAELRQGTGRRVRQLLARIGQAHHRAEGTAFSLALLAGEATPLQLAALLRNLAPAYEFHEQSGPHWSRALGADQLPWPQLRRSDALRRDLERLAVLPTTPHSAAAQAWLERLRLLALQEPHRRLAHVQVRYGGDLSGGQRLAAQAQAILSRHGLPPLAFWSFATPVSELKLALHAGIEQLELLEEAECAFQLTQRLLAELDALT